LSINLLKAFPYSTTKTIAQIGIVFPDDSTRTVNLTEKQVLALPKDASGKVIVQIQGKTQTFFFAYHVNPDAYTVSTVPIDADWWL
jgi:uncharacterized UPF0160 family protein